MPKTRLKDVQEAENSETAATGNVSNEASALPNRESLSVWDYMEALTIEQWQKHVWYLYRVAPKTVMSGNKPHYLETGNDAFREDFIKARFGGGTYRLMLNKIVGREQPRMYDEYFSVAGNPKLGPEEALKDGAAPASPGANGTNAELVSVLKTVFEDLLQQRSQAQAEGRHFDINQALEVHTKASTAAIEMVVARAKADGGTENKTMELLVTALLNRKEDPTQALLLNKLLDRALDEQKHGEDPFDKLTKYLDLSDRLRGNRGGGGRSDWASVGATLVQKLPEIFQNAAELIREAVIAKTALGPVISRPSVPTLPAAGAPGAPTPAANPPAPAPANQQELYHRAVIIERIKSRIVAMAENAAADGPDEMKETGLSAANLAELMEPIFARELANVLQTNPAALAGDPVLSRCQTFPNIQHFAAGYLEYFTDEAPEPEPAAQPAAVA